MSRRIHLARGLRIAVLLAAFVGTPAALAAKPDLDLERLRASLGQLKSDPVLGPLAPAEIALAEQALLALSDQGGKGHEHDHLVYIAERRIDVAFAAAQAVDQERRLQKLDREHDQILLAASRRDAEQARLELEKQRIQSLAQAEESDRLRAEADEARQQNEQSAQAADNAKKQAVQARKLADAQAREAELARKEAELLAASGAKPAPSAAPSKPAPAAKPADTVVIADAFASGQAALKPAAQTQIARIVNLAGASKTVRVEAHADASALAQQRARAVHDALVASGIPARRISVTSSVVKGAGARQVSVTVGG